MSSSAARKEALRAKLRKKLETVDIEYTVQNLPVSGQQVKKMTMVNGKIVENFADAKAKRDIIIPLKLTPSEADALIKGDVENQADLVLMNRMVISTIYKARPHILALGPFRCMVCGKLAVSTKGMPIYSAPKYDADGNVIREHNINDVHCQLLCASAACDQEASRRAEKFHKALDIKLKKTGAHGKKGTTIKSGGPEECANCHKSYVPGTNVVKCGQCRAVNYCSEKCRDKAWDKGHSKVCVPAWNNENIKVPVKARLRTEEEAKAKAEESLRVDLKDVEAKAVQKALVRKADTEVEQKNEFSASWEEIANMTEEQFQMLDETFSVGTARKLKIAHLKHLRQQEAMKPKTYDRIQSVGDAAESGGGGSSNWRNRRKKKGSAARGRSVSNGEGGSGVKKKAEATTDYQSMLRKYNLTEADLGLGNKAAAAFASNLDRMLQNCNSVQDVCQGKAETSGKDIDAHLAGVTEAALAEVTEAALSSEAVEETKKEISDKGRDGWYGGAF